MYVCLKGENAMSYKDVVLKKQVNAT
jgi:hypothetical protein